MSVTLALFVAGIAMGIAGAFAWAWAVHSGQLSDLEQTKHQVFWPEIAGREPHEDPPRSKR